MCVYLRRHFSGLTLALLIMETVTISKTEYERLVEGQLELNALHQFGVDNWCWYDDAVSSIQEEEESVFNTK